MEQYQFGYPEAKRVVMLQEAMKTSTENYSENYQGKYRPLPVVEVRIESLVYRIENIRTKNLQKEWLAQHPELKKDFFSRDPFSIETQEAQHELLKKLVDKENLINAFKNDGLQQTLPLICSDNGIVVNGNRRLCAWRELYFSNKDKYKHFEMVRVAVLPNHDKVGMYDLEVALQIQSPMKAEYVWHSVAADCREKADAGIDISIIAKKQGKTVDEVNMLIDCYDYATEYLESIGHPDEWSLVDKQEFAFKEIVKGRRNLKNPGDKELFQEISKAYLQTPTKGERLYSKIPKIATHLKSIAPKLTDVFDIPVEESDKEDDVLSLLDGGDQGEMDMKNAQIAEAIRVADEPVKIVETVRVVLDSCDALEKEKKKKSFVLDQLVKASTLLNNAVSNLDDSMDKKGVDKQLENIENACIVLKDWIK